MRARWVLCAQLWACQALAIEPGQGFSVHLDWPLVAQHIQSIEPVALQYRVNQCEQFTAVVQHRSAYPWTPEDAPWRSVPVDATADGHGHYVASLGVGALLDDSISACWASPERPDLHELRLAVTCSDGRQAVSAPVQLQYATAMSSANHEGSESHDLHVLDANRLLIASPAGIHLMHLDRRTDFGTIPEVSQSVGLGGSNFHQMAHSATHAYVGGDCLYPRCTPMTVQDPVTHARLSLESADIFIVDLQRPYDPNDHAIISGMVQVPGPIVYIFADSDGSLLVVSHAPQPESVSGGLGALGGWTPGVVVSRVTGDTVRTEMVLDDAIVVGHGISTEGLFLTATQDRGVHLRRVQSPRTGMRLALDPNASPHRVWPSPDGRLLLVSGANRDDVCVTATGKCTPLQAGHPLDTYRYSRGPVWLSDGVGVIDDQGQTEYRVNIFNLDGTLRGVARRPRNEPPGLVMLNQVVSLSGDRIAMADMQHVRIFDRTGQLLGGTVLPNGCGGTLGIAELPGDRLAWMSLGPSAQVVFTMDLAAM